MHIERARAPLILIALSALVLVPGWGDGWRDPKIFLLLLGLLLFFLQRLFSNAVFFKARELSWALGLFAGLLVLQCLVLPVQLSLILPVLFGVAMMAVLAGQPGSEAVLRLMLAVAGLEGALVLVQFFWFDPLPGKPITDFLKWRSTGTMGNPNLVAAYLGIQILIFLEQKKITRLMWGLAGVFIFLPFLLTFSRSAYLALFFAMAFFIRGSKRFWVLGAGVFFVGLFAVFIGPRSGLFNVDSLIGRWDENLHAFSYLKGWGWLWGIGWNHYRFQSGAASDFIHNEFLGALVEGGVLGLGFLIFIFASGTRAFRANKTIALYVFVLCLVDFPLRNPAFLGTLVLLGLLRAAIVPITR